MGSISPLSSAYHIPPEELMGSAVNKEREQERERTYALFAEAAVGGAGRERQVGDFLGDDLRLLVGWLVE